MSKALFKLIIAIKPKIFNNISKIPIIKKIIIYGSIIFIMFSFLYESSQFDHRNADVMTTIEIPNMIKNKFKAPSIKRNTFPQHPTFDIFLK